MTIVRSVIPENLVSQCLGCSVNYNQLTIYSHSAVWISQLRFYQSEILNAVNDSQSGYQFSTVKFRVMVTQTGASQATHSSHTIVPSHNTIDMIEDSAKHVTDQQLGAKLKHLAQTLRSRRA
ncbi:MAG: DciA family protein [Gammaproteobacteria bacterium]|nr:DciA family protein [Gammaproteobacteria bacterium]